MSKRKVHTGVNLMLPAILMMSACSLDRPTASTPPSQTGVLVSVRTVGDQLDSDGYTLTSDDASAISLPIKGEVHTIDLTDGLHSFDVKGIAPNCRWTNSSSSRRLDIQGRIGTRLNIEVFCLRPNPGTIFYTIESGSVRTINALGGGRETLPLLADQVSVASDQTRITYNWDHDIWTANADGSEAVNLTNSPGKAEERPRWSPDGRHIAFMGNEVIDKSEFDIFIMDADGMEVTNLTPNTPDWTDGEPNWSPDGTRIVFRSHRSSRGDLWIMARDGSQLVQLTSGGSIDTNARWSPDGQKLVFTRFTGALDKGGTDFELFMINADGTQLKQLTKDSRRTSEADWSPDGRWIVFASGDLGEKPPQFDLFIMRADGTDRLQLTFDERPSLPSWVP